MKLRRSFKPVSFQPSPRAGRGTHGLNLIESIVFLLNVTFGVLLAQRGGRNLGWYGYPLGFIGGFLILPAVILIWNIFYARVYGDPGILPPCQKGKCQSADYKVEKFMDDYVYVCRCGDRYQRRPGRFYTVMSDGSMRPYLVWRAFKGWSACDEIDSGTPIETPGDNSSEKDKQ